MGGGHTTLDLDPPSREHTAAIAPTASHDIPLVGPLRFAAVSCQHFESGYYAAYRHMLADIQIQFDELQHELDVLSKALQISE